MLRLIAVIALMMASAPHAVADGHLAQDKIALEAEKWAALYAKRDLDGLMTLYHEDAMLFTSGAPALIGPAAIRAYFENSFQRVPSSQIDFKIEKITVFGDVANLVSLFRMDLDVGEKEPMTVVGRSMLMYKRDAFGNWLLFADMDNRAPDATAQTFAAAE